MHAWDSYSSRPTGSDFTKRRRKEVDGATERPLRFGLEIVLLLRTAAGLKLAGRHPGGEIRDPYYT